VAELDLDLLLRLHVDALEDERSPKIVPPSPLAGLECATVNESVEIDRPKGEAAGPRSNSYNFVPAGDIGRAPGAPCPLAATQRIPFGRSRTLLLRLKDRMRVFYTETQDFSEDELFTVKEGLGQVYADISTKLAPDDFARDLRKLQPSVECVSCPRRQECPGCWDPARDDVFSRDDARVQATLAELKRTAQGEGNTVPSMLEACRAEATLGEICGVLRDLWGSYTEPPRF